MSTLPLWVGNTQLIEEPTSPTTEHDATKLTVKRSFKGPYLVCYNAQPARGQVMSGWPAGVIVSKSNVSKLAGNMGRLEITAETFGPSDSNAFAPTYEIEWRPIEKKLETHPIFVNGKYTLSDSDYAALVAWEAEQDPVLKHACQWKVPQDASNTSPNLGGQAPVGTGTIAGVIYNIYALSSNASVLATKKLRGQDSYRAFFPVARIKTRSFTLPTTNPCNIVGAPSFPNLPVNYVWISSADSATRSGESGTWERTQEWEGSDSIDQDIYENIGTPTYYPITYLAPQSNPYGRGSL